MKVKELKDKLLLIDPDVEIMILDGSNGGGYPRVINFGITGHVITEDDAFECGDCEDMVGEVVALLGFGSY